MSSEVSQKQPRSQLLVQTRLGMLSSTRLHSLAEFLWPESPVRQARNKYKYRDSAARDWRYREWEAQNRANVVQIEAHVQYMRYQVDSQFRIPTPR